MVTKIAKVIELEKEIETLKKEKDVLRKKKNAMPTEFQKEVAKISNFDKNKTYFVKDGVVFCNDVSSAEYTARREVAVQISKVIKKIRDLTAKKKGIRAGYMNAKKKSLSPEEKKAKKTARGNISAQRKLLRKTCDPADAEKLKRMIAEYKAM
jgi:hypothetical protein